MINSPKILVISNESLSLQSSNGRTLSLLLKLFDPKNVANFYTGNKVEDPLVCLNYYRVSDLDVFNSFRFNKKKHAEESINSDRRQIVKKRTPLTKFFRNLVWKYGRWNKKGLYAWATSFKPDVIVVQAGDSSFIFDLAIRVSKITKAKIIIYNSENYYFKKYDYFKSKGFDHLFYPFFRLSFKKHYKKLVRNSFCTIYSTEDLLSLYSSSFSTKSFVIYTSASKNIASGIAKTKTTTPIFSYSGNLGVGRLKSLQDFGDVLNGIDSNMHIDVYGKLPNNLELENKKGILYRGVVPYKEVTKIIENSDVVVHVESFEDFYKKDLEYAFSTKIADLLKSSKCFVLYCPKQLSCYKYLKKYNAAYLASNQEELADVLKSIIYSDLFKNRFSSRAEFLCSVNHNEDINSNIFRNIVLEAIK